MKKSNSREIVLGIVGPNASGKSVLAVKIAKKFDGEVVSADSRQVYRGLDIGSGKITKTEMAGIPHHMLSVASPERPYNVARYQKEAQKILKNILKKGRLPIICGGTGFYVDALLYGTAFPKVSPDWKLRRKLYKKNVLELYKILKKLDPKRARDIEKQNPVRLIRAIEIAEAFGRVPELGKTGSPYKVLLVGLRPRPEEIKKRIRIRLKKRLKIGLVGEVRRLHQNGLSWKRLENLGLEYRCVANYLQGKTNKEKMLENIEEESFRYAKRQIRWFKRNKKIHWFPKPNKKLFRLVSILKKL